MLVLTLQFSRGVRAQGAGRELDGARRWVAHGTHRLTDRRASLGRTGAVHVRRRDADGGAVVTTDAVGDSLKTEQ
jgi:hypothetical protein